MPVAIEDLWSISRFAAEVVSELYEAHSAADRFEASRDESQSKRFLAALYAVESTYRRWWKSEAWSNELIDLLASVNHGPVSLGGPVEPSAHEAVLQLAGCVGYVASEVLRAEYPDLYKPGVEYPVEELFCEPDMLRHIDVAIAAFREHFPSYEILNTAHPLLRQETARAARELGAAKSETDDDAHPAGWSQEDIQKWKDSIPDRKFRFAGLNLQVKHLTELLQSEWEVRVGTSFPGISVEALQGVAAWAGLTKEQADEMTAGEIYDHAMEVLGRPLHSSQELDDDPLVTLEEFAGRIGRERTTLYNWATAHSLPAPETPKAGRRPAKFRLRALYDWLKDAQPSLYEVVRIRGFPPN